MLASPGTGKARWLSLLAPLVKIERSYVSLIAFLSQQFETEKDADKKHKAQQTFRFLASWEFRFTLAGIVDILQECWRAKTLLERRTTGKQVRSVLLELEAGLGVIGSRAASVADMMHGKTDEINRAIAAEFGDAEPALAVERCLQ